METSSGINVQHDGAKPHNGMGNLVVLTAAGLAHGWNIKFITQPAQSPDLSILDLGFFSSLKSRVAAVKQNTIDCPRSQTNVSKLSYGHFEPYLDAIGAVLD